ncbi:MAG: DNA translocase FtsK [Candidatus Omnitrophota bacterium]
MSFNEKNNDQKHSLHHCIAVVLLAISIFTFISLISYTPDDIRFNISSPNLQIKNFGGRIGAYFCWGLIFTIGWAGYFFPLVILFWAVGEYFGLRPRKFWIKILGIIILFFALSAFLSSIGWQLETVRFNSGGTVGFYFSELLIKYFGRAGSLIILFLIVVLSFYVCTDFLIMSFVFHSIANSAKTVKNLLKNKTEPQEPPVDKQKPRSLSKIATKFAQKQKIKPQTRPEAAAEQVAEPVKIKIRKQVKLKPFKLAKIPAKETTEFAKQIGDYKLPTLDLLNSPPPEMESMALSENYENNSKILEETLRDFGIEARVVEVEQGPTVTRYELQPAPGVKVNKIVSLNDDIALTMKAHSVRIIAPIPGKSRVGIEVPNSAISMVYLQELLSSAEFQSSQSKLTLALGKDTSGASLITDLDDMPHILIAGTTGSGKTVCVNSLIMSMLFNATPEEIKFLMIDPKMVELSVYNGLPHLVCPVVTDARKAAGALNWVVNEMDERYKILAKLGVRNISYYNKKIKELKDTPFEHLPYIVVVIDELADLMLIAAKDVEEAIMRLAQLARAVGIHVILATQRPSVDVVTGVIKANFPARISFKVASKVDSRTVLDMNGADKLLGKGDMLFLRPGQAKPIRAQCSLVLDTEIERVMNFIKSQRETKYTEDVLKHQEKIFSYKDQKRDELFDQAVKLVIDTGQASVSMLQRRLRLGYTRAARLIDMMEEEQIIGGYRGSKPREILVDSWEGLDNLNDDQVDLNKVQPGIESGDE